MLEFVTDTHTYYWDGRAVPSVTQIIGEWKLITVYGVEYYYNIYTGTVLAAEMFVEARDFGRAVHDMNALYLKGALDQSALHPSLVPVLEQFDAWLRTFDVEPILIETPLYSERFQYAGTPDLVCMIRRRVTIVDYKTGAFDMAGPQLAAYGMLYKSRLYKQRKVLRLPKSGGQFAVVDMNDALDWPFFQARLYQHNYLERSK